MPPEGCGVIMTDSLKCLRPIYPYRDDDGPRCLMHSSDPGKSPADFHKEITSILSRGSKQHHRYTNSFEFYKFVFPTSQYFNGCKFEQQADFRSVTFIEGATFTSAEFFKGANFTRAKFFKAANFRGAEFGSKSNKAERINSAANFGETEFIEGADFSETKFSGVAYFEETKFVNGGGNFFKARFDMDAVFRKAIFQKAVDFVEAQSLSVIDFSNASFIQVAEVRFFRMNQKSTSGLRARFLNCNVEGVQFDAVHWHQHKGRMVLQDELDTFERPQIAPSYEEVAITYRRLIANFEKRRAYDLVQDCTIGEFEMKRRNPDRFLFAKLLKLDYECCPFLRAIGERASIVGIYHLASLYGTSYQRAMAVLGILLLVFGLCFSTIVDIRLAPTLDGISICTQSNTLEKLWSGAFHALEVATLQRTWLYESVSFKGRIVEILEQVLVAGQAALLLFSLRRRFHR